MSSLHNIIDNQQTTVAEHLKRHLSDADSLDFVSAYFSIYGYELLMGELESLDTVRFLFGDPTSVDDLDPGAKEPKSFTVTEDGLAPNHAMLQKFLARRCAEWVRKDSVAIRSISQSDFLHGKMYMVGSKDRVADAVVGSSNFTKRGLGGSERPNLEINLAVRDSDTLAELRDWFDVLWQDDHRTEDVKQGVLDALARVGKDHTPEEVYYKTLYELFRSGLEDRLTDEDQLVRSGIEKTQVWKKLYEFQRDGAKSAIAKLRQHNGCILADSVGLGKTYTALAVIKHFELGGRRVLVLSPRKLYENWSLYPSYFGHQQNPFKGDGFNYTVLAHSDLSRESGDSRGVNLASFDWGGYGLVVIDESHNFRNDGGQRYQKLLNEVIKSGANTKVLMLSATPVNTSLIDLRNQIYLMSGGRESAFRDSLNVGNLRRTMASAQREFKQWEASQKKGERRDKTALLENLGPDFLRLLDGVSISRSRRHIKEFYAKDMARVGEFPVRQLPDNVYPSTDIIEELSFASLAERIGQFKLSLYRPSDYVTDDKRNAELEARRKNQNFNQRDSERFLVGMLLVNFLKRLESSPQSLKLTLERTIRKIDDLITKIDRYEKDVLHLDGALSSGDILPEDDEDDEDYYVNRGLDPYRLSELDLPRWLADLSEDRWTLSSVLAQVQTITPDRDGKLKEMRRAILEKVNNPSLDRDDKTNRKLLVFTTFKDTAMYLYENVEDLATEVGFTMAVVSGDETRTTYGENNFNSILTNFAPMARQRNQADNSSGIDLLIATDCISEGQNLQDCDTVLNYDIHWNPVRIIQRFGRIDRIGSRNNTVQMINYWPTDDMESYLNLQGRVQARMAVADLAATGDEDPFAETDVARELSFRDEQLLKLREEIADLEDLEGGPVISDFTLDYFIAQLLHYLKAHKEALEAIPNGAYALTNSENAIRPGVIFCLRQQNAADSRGGLRFASPVHPFYLVYILENGAVRYGCGNAQQTLRAFETASIGKTDALMNLCDRFDRETDQGRKMDVYDGLLAYCVAQIRQSHNRQQTTGLSASGDPDFRLPLASDVPTSADDFELVTWLVIKED